MILSLITINFNDKNGLLKTADSVLSQTFRDFEWIIIDGGSSDGSKEAIEKLAANPASNISYWCSEKDNGIYNAMNKGVAHAHGEYCQFLNSGDSYYKSNVLEEMISKGMSDDIVVGKTIFSNGEIFTVPEKLSLEYFIHASLSHPSSFSKRELLLRNPFDESQKIVSDFKFFLTSTIIMGATYQARNVIVTRFELDGISSKQMSLRRREREEVLKSLFNPMILCDYYKFLGDTDPYYNLFTTLYRSRFKWSIYNLVLCLIKLIMLNRGWAKHHHFHK